MLKDRLFRAIDWFIPLALRTDTASFWRARIFVLTHLFGPLLGSAIVIFLYQVDQHRSWPYWVICALVASFGVMPTALKLTGRLPAVALCSTCSLIFVSLFGSYFYGGVSSPFMPWFITALLLGFFYFGHRPLLVLAIFACNLIAFCLAYALNGFAFPELVPLTALSGVGVISVSSATVYTSLMAIYYAYVVASESEFQREVSRHRVTAAKMRTAKEEAERANMAKSVFLAKMSHHLRTPLNAVIGYSELLLEDAETSGGDGERMADLQRINRAGRHLLSLVSDVLDMSKIDLDNIELMVQPFDLRNFIDDVAATCRSLVTVNSNEFVVDEGVELGVVSLDETRLRQIVINLLSNAGKFTSRGRVTLRVERLRDGADDRVVMTVSDTGIGISPENLAKLFKDFNQAEASTASKYGGTGLGLALSRRLCELMEGEIDVASEVGRGTTFTVRVPARLQPSKSAAAAAA
jgi:signal transduction histidine kinase